MTAGVEQRLRAVRVIHFTMLTLVVLLVPLGERIATDEGQPGFLLPFFAAIAAVEVVLALVLRKSLVGGAEEHLRQRPEDAVAAMRWQTGQLGSFAMAESVALFGFMCASWERRWSKPPAFTPPASRCCSSSGREGRNKKEAFEKETRQLQA